MLRIRILQTPPLTDVDGIALDGFEADTEYEVGNAVGALLLAEGWAVPIALDEPKPPDAFSPDDPYGLTTLDRNNPPNLVKENYPPYLERPFAADRPSRRRPRR